jgi:hypothetical protein
MYTLVQYTEIIAVCSDTHIQYKNSLRGQNEELFNVKPDGAYTNHYTVKANSHIRCRSHAVPLPCRAAKGLDCFFPI